MANTVMQRPAGTGTEKTPAKNVALAALKTAPPTASWAEIFAMQPAQENA